MASTNFLQWNSTQANQESDSAYLADSQRTGGAPTGVEFPSATANKLFYQVSTFIAALSNSLVSKGYSPMDSNISSLQGVLANIVTFADLKPNLTSVSFSTSPQFNAQYTNGFELDLAGNVTSSSLINYSVGQILTFVITQGSTAYSFVPPPNITGWIPINMNPGTSTVQQFIVQENTAIVPLSTEIGVILTELASLSMSLNKTITDETSSRSFGVIYTASSNLFVNVTGVISLGVGHTATIQALVGSVPVDTSSITNSSGMTSIGFFVPSGSRYIVNTGGIGPGDNVSASLYKWIETIGV